MVFRTFTDIQSARSAWFYGLFPIIESAPADVVEALVSMNCIVKTAALESCDVVALTRLVFELEKQPDLDVGAAA